MSETSGQGAEEKAAAVLNGVMIMALAVALASFCLWNVSGYLWQAVNGSQEFAWNNELILQLLIPLSLVVGAVRAFLFGLRVVRSRSRS